MRQYHIADVKSLRRYSAMCMLQIFVANHVNSGLSGTWVITCVTVSTSWRLRPLFARRAHARHLVQALIIAHQFSSRAPASAGDATAGKRGMAAAP